MSQIEVVRTMPRIPLPDRIHPLDAKEVAMRCESCGKVAYGPRHAMQAAMEEHRRIACTAGGVDERRVYRISYPGVRV